MGIKESLTEAIEKYRPDLKPYEDIYKQIHQNPELGCQEVKTASVVAKHLEGIGFKVREKIGGAGVAGILENGRGKTILLRSELDALPIEEKTELHYASRNQMKDVEDGATKPVMHACGHDMHMASLLAASKLLADARSEWSGTLIIVFQPNEERAGGARAMVDGGLYDHIPKPDILLAQHINAAKTGTVTVGYGAVMTAASTMKVRIFGHGGHGSAPHNCVDPIVLAGYILTRLQSVVSRETSPSETAIVTCGSIHGGEAANVIPAHVDLQLNVRAYDEGVLEKTLMAVRRIIKHECEASESPKEPEIDSFYRFPPTINDHDLVDEIRGTFGKYFGDNLLGGPPFTASEDFSILATSVNKPYVFWSFGGTSAQKYDEALKAGKLLKLPGNHSPYFAPDVGTSLKTGVDAAAVAALTFLAT